MPRSKVQKVEPAAPTPERRRRSVFALTPAVATESGPASAGARVYRALSTIERMTQRGSLEPAHADAANRLRDDFELGVVGLRQNNDIPSSTAGWSYSEARLEAARRFYLARNVIAEHQTLVLPIILHDASISEVAQHFGENRARLSALLKFCLRSLARHYECR